MSSESFNEHVGLELECSFENNAGEPTPPVTVHWRLYCLTSKTLLKDWATATVLTETDGSAILRYYTTIQVDGEYNALQSTRNRRELKRVLIVADKDQPREYSQDETYYIVNTQTR